MEWDAEESDPNHSKKATKDIHMRVRKPSVVKKIQKK